MTIDTTKHGRIYTKSIGMLYLKEQKELNGYIYISVNKAIFMMDTIFRRKKNNNRF